jgi:hypothetical protein
MNPFETTSITVAYRQRCEDRVKVVDLDGGVVIVVADGAGGTGAGAEAAETVIREVAAAASLERDADVWCEVLRQTDHRVGPGESTCVVVARSAAGLVGASVGDSRAWLLEDDQVNDLTSGQVRKLREVLWIEFAVLARRLVEMVCLPSGDLWDDIGIVACRPRRPVRSRVRYEITDAD